MHVTRTQSGHFPPFVARSLPVRELDGAAFPPRGLPQTGMRTRVVGPTLSPSSAGLEPARSPRVLQWHRNRSRGARASSPVPQPRRSPHGPAGEGRGSPSRTRGSDLVLERPRGEYPVDLAPPNRLRRNCDEPIGLVVRCTAMRHVGGLAACAHPDGGPGRSPSFFSAREVELDPRATSGVRLRARAVDELIAALDRHGGNMADNLWANNPMSGAAAGWGCSSAGWRLRECEWTSSHDVSTSRVAGARNSEGLVGTSVQSFRSWSRQ